MKYEDIARKLKEKEPGIIGAGRYFSVIIPFVETDGRDELLFEVRSDDIKRQPGEICFPGGMKEKDETDVECAVRETCEELGILPDDVRIDAKLGALHTIGGDVITVYTGRINTAHMAPSPKEVKEVFTVPLDFFTENAPDMYYTKITSQPGEDFPHEKIGFPQGYPWRIGKGEVPMYTYEGYVIWGITGRIVKYFTERIEE